MTATMTTPGSSGQAAAQSEYVTFRIADQWLGIPVLLVQEVLVEQRIATVPMAPQAIAGFLNLRGQIVTAVDLRTTLQVELRESGSTFMNVVVQHEGELFAFMVDEVGDVVAVAAETVEPAPPTLDTRWRAACTGIIRRDKGLLIIMAVHELLRLETGSG